MGVAGHGNCWGMDPDGIAEDENFENIFSILDFPMESLEGNGFAGDWDASESHYLGPIPSNVLMEPLMNLGPSYKPSGPAAYMDGAAVREPVYDHVQGSSVSDIVQQSNPRGMIQEPVFFQTPSPISVLESSGSCSTQKNSPIKSQLSVPVRTRSKRVRASGVNPWLSVAPFLTVASASKEKSVNVRKQSHKLRKRSPQLPVVPESNRVFFQKVVTDTGVVPKRCLHCQVTKTPQWREGPGGPKTLCNACGMRYRSGRLYPEYRPAASPTFVPAIHSNSHKKVVQIRSKGKQVPSQPEFVPSIPSNSHNKEVVVRLESKGRQVPDNMFKMYEIATSPQPEFVPSIHSNRLKNSSVVNMYEVPVNMHDVPTSPQPESIYLNPHKEVLEMRQRKRKQVPNNMFRMYELPTSPQPEFVPMSSYLFDCISEPGAVSPPV